MDFGNLFEARLTGRPQHREDNIKNISEMSESSSEDEITLKTIIRDKPDVKTVREFLRANILGIKSEEEKLFS